MQEQLTPAHNTPQEPFPGLDAYVNEWLREWHVPGMALGIVKDDALVFAKGYGTRKLGEQSPINERTVFGVASVTKAFTAATVASLVDEGKVQWDDPVIKHLPDFQLYDPYVTRELTVRDLLCARAGLVGGDLMRYGEEGYDRAEVVRRLRYLKPGLGFRAAQGSYTFMFLVAGQLVAAVTGKSWDEVVRERIFTPLGMTTSNTLLAKALRQENIITPHIEREGVNEPTFWASLDNVGPGGSISSNIVDLAQWVRLHLSNGTYNGQELLSAAVMDEMHTPQIIDRSQLPRINNPQAHFITYGMGWYIADYLGRKVVEHGGSGFGMCAFISMLPEEQLGLIILANTGFVPHMMAALKLHIFDAYLHAPQRNWNSEYLQQWHSAQAHSRKQQADHLLDLKAHRVANTHLSLPLDQYAGTYDEPFYGKAIVRLEENHLVFHYGMLIADLEHWHFDTFKSTWRPPFHGDDLFTFTLDAMGKVDAMKVTDFANFTRIS